MLPSRASIWLPWVEGSLRPRPLALDAATDAVSVRGGTRAARVRVTRWPPLGLRYTARLGESIARRRPMPMSRSTLQRSRMRAADWTVPPPCRGCAPHSPRGVRPVSGGGCSGNAMMTHQGLQGGRRAAHDGDAGEAGRRRRGRRDPRRMRGAAQSGQHAARCGQPHAPLHASVCTHGGGRTTHNTERANQAADIQLHRLHRQQQPLHHQLRHQHHQHHQAQSPQTAL